MKKGVYKHYKGNLYFVDKVVRDSETENEIVIYQCMYDDKNGERSWWARDKVNFLQTKVIDGVELPRFTFIGLKDYLK
jgi:hypothetical protein